jgi:hypothetical protein
MFRSVVVALLLFSCFGCNKELPLPESGQRKIVLLGEMVAADTVLIRAGQSTPFATSTGHALIQGLQVVLKDAAGVPTSLAEREDPNASTLNTLPFSAPIILAAGKNYQVTAKHATLAEANAIVTIPKAFVATLNSVIMVSNGGDSALQFDIDINDVNAGSSYYAIEAFTESLYTTAYFQFAGTEYSLVDNQVLYDSLKLAGVPLTEWSDTTHTGLFYRANVYTTDPNSDNVGAGTAKRYKRLFLQGKTFSGNTHRIAVFVPKSYGSGFGQLTQTTVYVKSVADRYYDFLKAYEQYDGSVGTGSNVPPGNLPGNVQGGLGMIGGAFRVAFNVVR